MLKSNNSMLLVKGWQVLHSILTAFKTGQKKKNCCIFLGGTSNHLPAIAAVVLEINEHLPNVDDIIIYLDRIDKKQIKILKSLSKINIIIKKYNLFLGVKYNNGNVDYFSTMVFCKFEGFKLLNKYKKVIWTDYDVAIKENIEELVSDYNSGLYTLDTYEARAIDNFHHPVSGLNMDAKASYCALIIFNEDIGDYNKMHKSCYEYTRKYINELRYGEQAIFNIVIDKYNIPVDYIDPQVYSCGVEDACLKYREHAKILHAYGQENKFWNGKRNDIYEKNYSKWIAAGGIEITNKRKESKLLKKLHRRHII